MASEELTRPAEPATHTLRWLLAITLLGAMLRLYGLGAYSLWYDEAASILLARHVETPAAMFDTAETNEPPMMAVLACFWGMLVDFLTDTPRYSAIHDFTYRLLPAIAGIINIPLLYFVCTRFSLGAFPALAAAFLFAISPFQVYYAQELRIYSILTTLALLAFIAFAAALERNKLWAWIALTLLFPLMLYSHFISVWYILALNIIYVLGYALRFGRLVQWTLVNAVALVLSIPAIQLGLEIKEVIDQITFNWYEHPTIKSGLITFKGFFFGYGPGAWAYWPLFIIALALFCAGIYSLRRNFPVAVLLLFITIFPVASNLVFWSFHDFSFYEHRTYILSGVTAIILVAAGINALPGAYFRAAALLAITLLSIPALLSHYSNTLHPVEAHRIGVSDKIDFRSASKLIHENWQEGDLLVYPGHFMVYSMQYYLTGLPQKRVSVVPMEIMYTYWAVGCAAFVDNHRITPEILPDPAIGAKRVWVVRSFGITFDYQPNTEAALAWMRENWKETGSWNFRGIGVILFDTGEFSRKHLEPPRTGSPNR